MQPFTYLLTKEHHQEHEQRDQHDDAEQNGDAVSIEMTALSAGLSVQHQIREGSIKEMVGLTWLLGHESNPGCRKQSRGQGGGKGVRDRKKDGRFVRNGFPNVGRVHSTVNAIKNSVNIMQ